MSKKKFYTKTLGNKVAVSAKPMKSGKYHVIIGNRSTWNVVADGNTKATKAFPTRVGAIAFAKETAIRNEGQVIIHKETGEIEERLSLTD